MRRSHIRDYYELPPSNSSFGSELIEIENGDLKEHLKDKVNTLKSHSIEIGTEVKYQDRLLRDMNHYLESTGRFLSNILGRIIRFSSNISDYNKLYILMLFSLVVFLILYIYI